MRLDHDEFSCPQAVTVTAEQTGRGLVPEDATFELSRKIATSGIQNDAFLLANEDQLHENCTQWATDFPMIEPYFDVSYNACPWLLQTLAQDYNVKFSCHSKAEIQHLVEQGINGANILFTHHQPKMASHIKFANASHVSMMAIATLADLKKAQKAAMNGLLLVLQGEDHKLWLEMFNMAKESNLEFVGVSCDSGDSREMAKKLGLAKMALAFGRSVGHPMSVIDLGTLRNADKAFFKGHGPIKGLTLIGHLGADFIEDVFTSSAKIIGKRQNVDGSSGTLVINDGIFHSFQRLLVDDQHTLNVLPLLMANQNEGQLMDVDIYGSSGDDMDILVTDYGLEMNGLERDDWLYFSKMGAFSFGLHREMISVKLPAKFGNFRLFTRDVSKSMDHDDQETLDVENVLISEEGLEVVFLDIQGNLVDSEQQSCLDLFEELPSLTDLKFCDLDDFYSDLNR